MGNDSVLFEVVTDTPANIAIFLELEQCGLAQSPNMYEAITNSEEAKEFIKSNAVFFIRKYGMIVGMFSYEVKNSDCAYISGLVIKADFKGQGLCSLAIDFRLDQLKGFKRVYVVTHPNNKQILDTYLRRGFVEESRDENYFGKGKPRVLLSRVKSDLTAQES